MTRNPDWARDELILAMDLYISAGRRQLKSNDVRVVELSQILNRLRIHSSDLRAVGFRNPTGVSMKLANFLSIDPDYDGVGLQRGSKLEQEIWDEFAEEPYRLRQVASAIRKSHSSIVNESVESYDIESEEEFQEGRILTRLHKQRERNPRATKRKKAKVLAETGRLACEVCGFDFVAVYGEHGYGFAECHHCVPLTELGESQRTRLSDLVIVCANCHRMLHRGKTVLTIEELQQIMTHIQSSPPQQR